MFEDFALAGLTLENLQTQVLGILGTPFFISVILAVLALYLVPRISRTLLHIVMGGTVREKDFENPYIEPDTMPMHRGTRSYEQHRQRMREHGRAQDNDYDDHAYNSAA